MYVIIPLRLRFHLDKNQHTVRTAERFKEPMGLTTQIEAIIADTYNQALNLMIKDVKQFISRFENVKPEDFTLVYSIQKIESNRFFATPGASSEKRLDGKPL